MKGPGCKANDSATMSVIENFNFSQDTFQTHVQGCLVACYFLSSGSVTRHSWITTALTAESMIPHQPAILHSKWDFEHNIPYYTNLDPKLEQTCIKPIHRCWTIHRWSQVCSSNQRFSVNIFWCLINIPPGPTGSHQTPQRSPDPSEPSTAGFLSLF